MMEESNEIRHQGKTFALELVRSVPQGFVETSGTTFAMYVAIQVFEVPVWMKMSIAAAASVGLLLSLFAVQVVRRLGCSVNSASVAVWLAAAMGFAMAAMSGDSAEWYFSGVCLAAVFLALGIPLMSQIYRKHYTNRARGKLFSLAGLVRAVVAALAGIGVGSWLAGKGVDFHPLFWFYSVCCLAMALCVLAMARVRLRRSVQLQLFDAFSHVSEDRAFRKLLICWMLLGMGNLLGFALFVEYITNPDYGYALDAAQAGMITSTIPMLAFIVCVVPWGIVFDRVPFYRVRILVNVFFLTGILVYYLGGSYWALCVGIALHGIARAGGNVIWSLWVTKFAPADHVGEYMSVHSCLTGVRGVLAPVIAFSVAGSMGPGVVALAGGVLVVVSSLMLLPELIEEARGQR
ncbi:MFS transporter [Verrucomicrobiaceae bacterium N1E253]|uniref:MFS transporter n=1 Tax=Oceaniferula marina TaxID=2748318 RepID=A0A851GLQ9_9BACT|nr:MFS transporter [Oceaniferula marina]NWK55710.1 MFS transporter [Oceaniferula marina]